MNWPHTLLSKIITRFKGAEPALAKVGADIENLMPFAEEIVTEINTLAPNQTLSEINTIATKYALPTISALEEGQTTGNVLLNLGTQILAKNHAPQAATSLLNTVIQLAVVAVKAAA